MNKGWIGVDLDGTLAEYNGWVAPDIIGAPIPLMIKRVKQWLKQGLYDVKIMTARVANLDKEDNSYIYAAITNWCLEHIGQDLPVTHQKDYQMVCLWDDRCVAVEPNTGELQDQSNPFQYTTGVKRG